MACLILDSEAKVSHQNSALVQTMILMRSGQEGGEKRVGERFNGRPIRTNTQGENKAAYAKV